MLVFEASDLVQEPVLVFDQGEFTIVLPAEHKGLADDLSKLLANMRADLGPTEPRAAHVA